uniref:Zinc knuckle CX2CX4HX4C domain-containing protein n=1 Tax=Cannabis sativa TaxID=3483 RepID=A0A803Q5Q0_CANSA
MHAVVLSNPRMEAIIAPTGYGDTIGILKGLIQHLHTTFLCKSPLSRYFFNVLYLRFWFLWRSLLVHLFVPSFLPVAFLSRVSLSLTMDSLALNISEVLNLTDREAVVHDLEDDTGGGRGAVSQTSRTFCLVFRILSPRTIKLEWFEVAMRNAWITRGPLTFSEYGSTQISPFWIQVHSIPFGQKSLKLAKLIGDEVGDFLEVDKLTLFKVSELFLRVCVLIDISKPITRGIMVDFKSIHREKWLTFKYENVPNICYYCGMFDHTLTKCITYLQKYDDRAFPPDLPYKIPLKALAKSTFKRNPFDLSNSFPLDELLAQQENVDQSLAVAVSQFLTTEDIGSGSLGAASRGNVTEIGSLGVDHVHSSIGLSHEGSPLSHDGFHSTVLCDLPFTTTQHAMVTASESSSEGIAMEGVFPRTFGNAKGKAVAGAKRAAFLPQTVVVGDSIRNILKRARAGPTIVDVSSAINLSLEQAGVAGQPRPEK